MKSSLILTDDTGRRKLITAVDIANANEKCTNMNTKRWTPKSSPIVSQLSPMVVKPVDHQSIIDPSTFSISGSNLAPRSISTGAIVPPNPNNTLAKSESRRNTFTGTESYSFKDTVNDEDMSSHCKAYTSIENNSNGNHVKPTRVTGSKISVGMEKLELSTESSNPACLNFTERTKNTMNCTNSESKANTLPPVLGNQKNRASNTSCLSSRLFATKRSTQIKLTDGSKSVNSSISVTNATEDNAKRSAQREERAKFQELIKNPNWDMRGDSEMYVFGKLLGQGSFGVVRLAFHKLTGQKVAIKTCEKANVKSESQLTRLREEMALTESFNHMHLIRSYECFENSKRIHMVIEAATGGNLCTYVKSKRRLPEDEAQKIFFQVVLAVEYLHSKGVCHRDIKLENVLFDSNQSIKLVDFGFATKADDKLKVFCGTPSYMAPEIVRRVEYDGLPVDIWSMGVLFYSMLSGRFPFSGTDHNELYKKIAQGQYRKLEWITRETDELLTKMLCMHPSSRIAIGEIKDHQCLARARAEYLATKLTGISAALISEKPQDDIQPALIKQLVDFGFHEESLIKSILHREHNHATATYYLLVLKHEKKKLESLAKLDSSATIPS